jgi:hypothetical protein
MCRIFSQGPIARQLQTKREDVTFVAMIKFFECTRVTAPHALNEFFI